MPRIARLVVPGLPHHVTQRGNRREIVFFGDDDYETYLGYLREGLKASGSRIWAWCLMPNHVHLIVMPEDEDGLRATVTNTHRRYAAHINSRNLWTGHQWQCRYGSVVMDEWHLYNAFAYVVLNPVRAGLVKKAEQWRWSSIHAHLGERDDGITHIDAAERRVGNFRSFLKSNFDEEPFDALRKREVIGRLLGDKNFIADLEMRFDRKLAPQKRSSKPSKGE